MTNLKAMKQYQKVGISSGLENATPHRLVKMLLDGALDKIATAKGALEHNEIARKGEYIGWAISILGGLRASLDLDAGGEIAANLDALYEYMSRRLAEANLDNDPAILDEVQSLLNEIKSAWDAIPQTVQSEFSAATAS